MRKLLVLASVFAAQMASGQVIYREQTFAEKTIEESRRQQEEFRENDVAARRSYENAESKRSHDYHEDVIKAETVLNLGENDPKATPNGLLTLRRCSTVLAAADNIYTSNDAESFKCHLAVNAVLNARKNPTDNLSQDNDDLTLSKVLKKAKSGDASAMDNIGYRYERGLTVPKDFGRALTWYREGAKKDNCYSQNSIGRFYMNGWGVAANYSEAHRWFDQAAKHGCTFAEGFIQQLRARGQI